jgi:hypothetical protein
VAVRVTQIPVETSISPTDAKIRVTQIATETSIAPGSTVGKIRVTQIAVETSILFGSGLHGQPNVFSVT